jgi:hypothetical protein
MNSPPLSNETFGEDGFVSLSVSAMTQPPQFDGGRRRPCPHRPAICRRRPCRRRTTSRFRLAIISTFPRLRHERAAEGVQSQHRYSLQLLDLVNSTTLLAGFPFSGFERGADDPLEYAAAFTRLHDCWSRTPNAASPATGTDGPARCAGNRTSGSCTMGDMARPPGPPGASLGLNRKWVPPCAAATLCGELERVRSARLRLPYAFVSQ